ncbi:hypothetical protein BU16DRAFT_521656 [Lophium mytilinum]|uniref:Altered inheritance of mitochondria protein 11 n=1 Tax=Lophium mytilinum TaxID=390894 RepID=A0A6A6RE35_9PEZI|nr:hypothetical protein BU16DRAFT_521656 [Lophium mytilinum]
MALLQRGSADASAPPPAELPAPASRPSADAASSSSSLTSPRSRKQLGLFVAGASFFMISTIITRRSMVRRYKQVQPTFYQPNTKPNLSFNAGLEAFEALNIATMNVASFSMMVAGGTLWTFDISSMDDLRRKIRGGLGVDGTGRSEQDAEEEIEEWLATVLARKDDKERKRKGGADEQRTNDRGAPR